MYAYLRPIPCISLMSSLYISMQVCILERESPAMHID